MTFTDSLHRALAPWRTRGAAWRTRATTWYGQRARREQRLLAAAAGVAAAAFVFLVLIEPAWSTVMQVRRELPGLRAQAATVAELTAQVRSLRRQGAGAAATAAPSVADLASSLQREGLAEGSWSLSEAAVPAVAATASAGAGTGQALTLTLRDASSAALFRWLDTAVRDWRLAVVDAELLRATHPAGRRLPGRLSGTLTLRPTAQP